jgi:hypothetical protein
MMRLKRFGLALSITLLLAAQASSRSGDDLKLPDTPAAKTLAAFLRAFNTGNIETMRKFHADIGGDENNAQEDMNFYDRSGSLKPHSVIRSSDYEIEVLVKAEKSGNWLNFTMQVGALAPHPPEIIRVQPASEPGDAVEKRDPPAAKTPTEAELVKGIESYLDNLSAEDRFSGAALLARDGNQLFKKEHGG